ncbi:MAG TPA: hypothetical protein VL994_02135 [Steroidobacteraceae bacterium]|nr:hypothetical protein [Steroidobacteraceae bacterium]
MAATKLFHRGLMGALVLMLSTVAAAQTAAPAAQPLPRPEDLEPGVNTSASPSVAAPTPPPAAAAPAGPQAGPVKAPAVPPAAAPRSGAAAKGAPRGPAGPKGPDRLNLEATDVTGNSELPKVLYIVPWKRSELGDMVGRPVNSLLDEVLQPLDRDVFKRENRYYDALNPGEGGAKPDAAQDSGVKP